MPEAGEIGIGAPQTRDIQNPLEIKRDSREDVTSALNSASELLDKHRQENLTSEEQWVKESVRDAHSKTIDEGKDTFTNSFEDHHTGEEFTQEEGIPVEGLLEFLRKKAEGLPPDSDERKELTRVAHVLYRNSQPYHRFPHRMEPSKFEGRVHHEAYLISKDSRVTGNEDGDWFKAIEVLNRRLELVIPEDEESPPFPAEPTTSETEEVAEPEPESLEQVRREFMFVNRTMDIFRKARELADEQLRNEMRRGHALNPLNWPRKIGLRIMEEFHRQRYIQRASRAMLENNNSYLSMNVVRNIAVEAGHRLSEEQQAGQAKVEQLKGGRLIEGQTIIEAQGTLREEIINNIIRPVIEGGTTNQEQIQQILRDFVQNHRDDPQVQAVFGQDATQYGRLAEYFATDLLGTGELVRQDIAANRYALEQLDSIVQIRLANTSWGGETQARLSAVDRAVSWAERHRLTGTLINPATLGAGFSIATFGLMRGLGVSARATQVVVPVAGLLPGALFAAARRNHDLKIDRASHQIERAYNRQIPQEARRREALEQFSYNTASVDELINGGGQELLTGNNRQSLTQLLAQDLSEGQMTNREAVVRRIAEMQSRLDFSSRERVDLITYQSREQVEQGRLELIRSAVEATHALRNTGMSNEEIQELENRLTGEWNSRFTQNRQQQDRAFARYRLRNAAGAAVFGGVAGLGMGLGAREGLEHLGINPVGGAIDKVRELLGHHEKASAPNIENFKDLYSQGGSVEVSDHFQAAVSPADHTVSIIDTNTNEAVAGLSKIILTHDGQMTSIGEIPAQVHDELQQTGFSINPGADIITSSTNDILTPSGTHIETLTGHSTTIPNGTEWIHDPADQSKWDLVVSGHPDKTLINDAHFDATGKIVDWDHSNSMDSLISVSNTTGEPQIITGGQAVDEWLRHGTQIDHREWYSYDQPESQGNELRLYDFKQGDSLVLDMSKMELAHQQGLAPNPINVRDVINNHESGFAFSLPGHEGQPVWIPDGADGQWDGLLHLNPNDTAHFITMPDGTQMSIADFSKMVLNQDLVSKFPDGDIASELYNHQDIFRLGADGKMGFIEAGRIVDHNGAKVLQTFATIRGYAEAQAIIPGNPVPVIDLTGSITETASVTTPSFDIIPPGEHPEIPIIPFPWSPRHPLEPLGGPIVIPPPLPPTYYGGESLTEAQNWITTHPEAHRQYIRRRNPDGTETWVDAEGNPILRDVSREEEDTEKYLNTLESTDPSHYTTLQELVTKIDPMKSEVRVAINVPAWMEGKNLYRVLDQYTKQVDKDGQELNPDLYEINIIVNRKTGAHPDDSIEEIERFKRDALARGKNYNINYIDAEFDPPFNNVGNARRVITDLVLLRSLNRTSQAGQLYIESEDADLINVDPRTVINLIDELDKNPHLDSVRGIQDRLPEAMMENDLVFLYRRAQDFKELLLRRGVYRPEQNPNANFTWNRVITGGWNTGYTAQAYAMIGGYNPYQTKGEDMTMGERFSMARGDGNTPNTEVIGRVPTRTDSSPRRYIYEVASGKAAYGSDFEDESVNQEIRDKTPEELMAKISNFARLNESNAETFARMLNSEYTFIRATTPNISEAQKVTGFVLSFLGLKKGDYEFKNESIEFKNWSNVQAALNNYRTRHIAPRKEGERTGHKTSVS